MKKNFLEKDQKEISNNQLLAYVMAKINPFEWVHIDMYHEENLFLYPPTFSWRYKNCDERVYSKIFECINKFKGNVEWTMYKVTKNYVIEPTRIHVMRLANGSKNLEENLKMENMKFLSKAIEDIPLLCQYIEKEFDVVNIKPFLPVF